MVWKLAGILYGVGVGPGDPELVTLKAKRILEEADCIAVPRNAVKKDSLALSIVRNIIGKDRDIIELFFPMSFDEKTLESSWKKAAEELRDRLDTGMNVAFITLGDPTVYSTYMYMHKAISNMGYRTEIIPGITSFCAAAARAGISLGENRETIAVVPSAYECDKLDSIISDFDNIVLMKIARKFHSLKAKLKEQGLDGKAVLVSRCGLEDELVEFDLDKVNGEILSYFTTMIIKKNGDV